MKLISSMSLVLPLVLSGGAVHGGTVKINQQVYPFFEVSAQGVEGLEQPVIAAGVYNLESYLGLPVNTEITFTPMSDGVHTYPAGRIGWKHEMKEKNKYTFFVHAGGVLDRGTEMNSYCLHVDVNYKFIGSKCTRIGGFWDPLIVEGVAFPDNSNLSITIKPRW